MSDDKTPSSAEAVKDKDIGTPAAVEVEIVTLSSTPHAPDEPDRQKQKSTQDIIDQKHVVLGREFSDSSEPGEKGESTRRKILMRATGMDAMAASVRHNTALPLKMGKDIHILWKRIFPTQKHAIILSPADDPRQRFEDAVSQFSTSEDDLKKRTAFSHQMFNVSFALFLLVVFLSFLFISPKGGFVTVVSKVMPALACMFLFLSSTVRWGFFNYKLRNRIMVPLWSYLLSPKDWLPSGKMQAKKFVAGLVICLSLSIPALAHADTATASSSCSKSGSYVQQTFHLPCDLDLYRNAMEGIFPEIGPLGAPKITATGDSDENVNGTSGVKSAIGAFIAVLMTVSMATISWHIISTIVSVSQEGTVLSQKWSLIWSPTRIFMGAGFLVPIKSGFCLAQILVLYAALWGGSLANIIWVAYINGVENPALSSGASTPYMTQYLKEAAISDVCYSIIDRINTVGTSQGGRAIELPPYPTRPPSPTKTSTAEEITANQYADGMENIGNKDTKNQSIWKSIGGFADNFLHYGQHIRTDYYTWDFGPCGSVSFPVLSKNQGAYVRGSWIVGGVQGTMTIPNSDAIHKYDDAKLNLFDNFLKKIHTQSSEILKKSIGNSSVPTEPNNASVVGLAQAFIQASGDVNNGLAANTVKFIDNVGGNNGNIENLRKDAENYGWTTAGSFYMNISRMQSMTKQFFNMTPVTTDTGSTAQNNLNAITDILTKKHMSSESFKRMADAIVEPDKYIKDSNDSRKTDGCGNGVAASASGACNATDLSNHMYSGSAKAGNYNGITTGQNTIGLDNPSYGFGQLCDYISTAVGNAIYELFAVTGGDNTSASSLTTRHGNPGSQLQGLIDFGQNIIVLMETLWAAIFFEKKFGWLAKGVAWAGALGNAAVGNEAPLAAEITETGIEMGIKSIMKGSAFVASALQTILLTIFGVGIMHAYLLPMLPYIQFLLFVMSMLILVVEGVIAAPIWAFMHIRLDGTELITNAQRAGYTLMFNIFLRAPLGMLGMLLSISVFNSTMLVMSVTFWPAVQSACAEGGTGIIGMLVMLVLMSYLHYQIAVRSFSLISAVPARVSKWFNANMGDEGEHNQMQSIGGFMAGRASTIGGTLNKHVESGLKSVGEAATRKADSRKAQSVLGHADFTSAARQMQTHADGGGSAESFMRTQGQQIAGNGADRDQRLSALASMARHTFSGR